MDLGAGGCASAAVAAALVSAVEEQAAVEALRCGDPESPAEPRRRRPPRRRQRHRRVEHAGDRQLCKAIAVVGFAALMLTGSAARTEYQDGLWWSRFTGRIGRDEFYSRRQLKTKPICKSVYQPRGKGVFEFNGDDGTSRNKVRGHNLNSKQKDKVRDGSFCTELTSTSPALFVMAILVTLYLFIGIAIVCDELFVSALEIISEKWDLSDDVSGATLMAAGGSAPELATAFIGTFQGSTVGLGTIVGSAVFNVLFVIGMCAMVTPAEFAPLKLTWWPLARDCSYYILTLSTLAFWFIGPTVGAISNWEAALQFMLYVGYVCLMAKNEQVEAWIKGRWGKGRVEPVAPESIGKSESLSRVAPEPPSFAKPSTFRSTIMHIIAKGTALSDTAGVGVVAKIKGDVLETFAMFDLDKDGKLSFDEIRHLLQHLGDAEAVRISDAEVDALRQQLDKNGDGVIDPNEFTLWYIQSASRLKAQAKEVFDAFDANGNKMIEVSEVKHVVEALAEGKPHLKTAIDQVVRDFEASIGGEECTFEQFQQWYETTVFWQTAQVEAAEAAEACEGMWVSTISSVQNLGSKSPLEATVIVLLLPLNLLLALTIPDCRVPGKDKYCYCTFIGSIIWIAIYAYFMVWCIQIVGCFLGVSSFIMGLIPLAAGTSVPDLLSSVVVAKQGKGDMAVSSSIGSNIFDVSVGLPLPWLAFTFVHGCPVQVGGSPMNNAVSVLVLLAMVFLVVTSIAACGWEMSKSLGAIMFGLYFAYCGQEIYRAT
ncbi:Sodium/calcium exchanger protein-domain-containing protein [Pelagophyceae sp. CCMP2097]|nr:Sodium/calcium exchanger protein-domain-containing protein [Pelagophyceae sp. CCMP2097]